MSRYTFIPRDAPEGTPGIRYRTEVDEKGSLVVHLMDCSGLWIPAWRLGSDGYPWTGPAVGLPRLEPWAFKPTPVKEPTP